MLTLLKKTAYPKSLQRFDTSMIFPFVCVSCRTVQQTHLLKFAPNYSKLCVVASCTADIISYPFCGLLSFLFGNNEPHYTALHTSSPSARECGEQQTALFLCSAAVLICLSHTLLPSSPFSSAVPCSVSLPTVFLL